MAPHTVHDSLASVLKTFEKDRSPSLVIKSAVFDDADLQLFIPKLKAGMFVRKLVLVICTITPTQLETLMDALLDTPLREIRMTLCKIDNAGCKILAKFVATNNAVRILVLSSNMIGDEGAKYLTEALKTSQVETVLLADNQLTDVGATALLEAVTTSKHIKELYLPENRITDHTLIEKIHDACNHNDPAADKEHQVTDQEMEESRSNILRRRGKKSGEEKEATLVHATDNVALPSDPSKRKYMGVRGIIEYLEHHEAWKADLAGAVSRSESQRVLALAIRARDPETLENVLASTTPAILISSVRAYFKLQKNSVIPPSAYEGVITESKSRKKDVEFAEYLSTVIGNFASLPDMQMFASLCDFLRKVISASVEDISVVWAPLVLRGPDDTLAHVKQVTIARRVVHVCLDHTEIVFKKIFENKDGDGGV